MIRRLAILTLTLLVGFVGWGNAASAQSFGDLPGLQRAVVRAWMAPGDSGGTPADTSAPGVVFLSIGAFDFDTDANAGAAWEQFATLVRETVTADPMMAGAEPKELGGEADQSISVTATRVEQQIPFTTVFTVVREADRVFLIQGSLVRVDGPAEVARMAEALVATPPGAAAETFVPEGTSTGGLWDILAAARPTLMPASVTFDSEVYPQPPPAATETPAS